MGKVVPFSHCLCSGLPTNKDFAVILFRKAHVDFGVLLTSSLKKAEPVESMPIKLLIDLCLLGVWSGSMANIQVTPPQKNINYHHNTKRYYYIDESIGYLCKL